MTKNRYIVTGITRCGGKEIEASCIAYDITSAIEMFKEKDIIVHTVPSRKQVNAETEIGIERVVKLPCRIECPNFIEK